MPRQIPRRKTNDIYMILLTLSPALLTLAAAAAAEDGKTLETALLNHENKPA